MGNSVRFLIFADVCTEVLNRRALESLVKCGAMDGLDVNRRQMVSSTDAVLSYLDDQHKQNVEGQIGFLTRAPAGRNM